MNIEKTIRINQLINVYGNLLNEKQLQVLQSYFYNDYSLSEIAENLSITRQAVSDLIKRVVKTLETYESKLNFVEKFNKVNKNINLLTKSTTDKQNLKILLDIKNVLEE